MIKSREASQANWNLNIMSLFWYFVDLQVIPYIFSGTSAQVGKLTMSLAYLNPPSQQIDIRHDRPAESGTNRYF